MMPPLKRQTSTFIEYQKRQCIDFDEAMTKGISQYSRRRNHNARFVQNDIPSALFTPTIHVVSAY